MYEEEVLVVNVEMVHLPDYVVHAVLGVVLGTVVDSSGAVTST